MQFELGNIFMTCGIQALAPSEILECGKCTVRHARCDWGELDEHDTAANNAAVNNGDRILSAYTLSTGKRIWIVTEADRSATTILLPSEY